MQNPLEGGKKGEKQKSVHFESNPIKITLNKTLIKNPNESKCF